MTKIFKLTQFDKIVILFLLSTGLLTGFVIWRGDQVGNSATIQQGSDGPPGIVYLGWESDEPTQIMVTDLDGSNTTQLTQAENGVLDFAISPDGTQIAYTLFRTDVETDLWLVDRNGRNPRELLICEQAACSSPLWTPDGSRLIFERRNIPTPGAPPGAPRLWWLDVSNSATAPVFQDSQLLGLGAQLSDDGEWLSYVSPVDQGIQVYNLLDGSGLLIPNQMGSPAMWTPGQDQLVMTNIQLNGDQWAIQLLSVDVSSEAITPLSGEDGPVDDSSPSWSPDGSWLAFGRKEPSTAMGRQVWLMRPDGSEAHPLTTNPDVHHGPFVWSPNGRYLLVQQYTLTELYAQPAIWRYDLETGEMQEIASPGSRPMAWLP